MACMGRIGSIGGTPWDAHNPVKGGQMKIFGGFRSWERELFTGGELSLPE